MTDTDKSLLKQLTGLNYIQASRLMRLEAVEKSQSALLLKLDNQREEITRLLQENAELLNKFGDWCEAKDDLVHWCKWMEWKLSSTLSTLEDLKKRNGVMTNVEEVEKDIPSNVTRLNSHSGGKDGGGNWLINLPIGCVFLTKEVKGDSVSCVQFHVKMKWNRGVYLHSNFPHGVIDEFFDSEAFSKKFLLIDILQESISSDNMDPRSGDMENHVDDVS